MYRSEFIFRDFLGNQSKLIQILSLLNGKAERNLGKVMLGDICSYVSPWTVSKLILRDFDVISLHIAVLSELCCNCTHYM